MTYDLGCKQPMQGESKIEISMQVINQSVGDSSPTVNRSR